MSQMIFYATVGICVVGSVSRVMLACYYRLQLRALKSMKSTKNRGMQKLKEQFILRYQAMLGVQNVDAFVGRFLAERRVLFLPLDTWNRLHMQLVSACLLGGAVNAMYCCMQEAQTQEILAAMFQGIWTGSVLLFVDGLCMITGKAEALRDGMCDYLENYLKVRLEHEYELWGKNKEENRQTKAVLEAQLRVIDEKEYLKRKKEEKQEKRYRDTKVQKDVLMLKQEVEERRRRVAEAAMTLEPERRVNRQLDNLLEELYPEG